MLYLTYIIMKKLFAYLIIMMLPFASSFGQNYRNVAKERKEIAKASRSELNAKASKAARKAAKAYAKEGWKVAPGQLPLERQLDKTYMMQYEYDEDYNPKYIMAEAMSVGENYDAAKIQALELAKLNLAGQIGSNIAALIKNQVDNKQLSTDDAASVTKTVLAGTNTIAKKLGRILVVVECYRETSKGTREVRVQIAYSSDEAMSNAKMAIREELESEGEELSEQLDRLLGIE